jgi:hypothetical protein
VEGETNWGKRWVLHNVGQDKRKTGSRPNERARAESFSSVVASFLRCPPSFAGAATVKCKGREAQWDKDKRTFPRFTAVREQQSPRRVRVREGCVN